MKTYTKEQLIQAQFKYNNQLVDTPSEFINNPDWRRKETADTQIEYLLSLVD